MTIRTLFIGDIDGKPGREAINEQLPKLREEYKLDFVVANAENSTNRGFGTNPKIAQELYQAGVDVITLGDHVFDDRGAIALVEEDRKALRPMNLPHGTAGKGLGIYTLSNNKYNSSIAGKRIAVVNLIGRVFMHGSYDCPFQASRKIMREYRLGEDYDAMIIDIHAEATSEKQCIGHLWDGKASLVVGTHTHVPTADNRIQPKGTGYQTDAGMTGNYNSSLGMEFQNCLARFEKAGRYPLNIADGEGTLCGVYAEIDENTGLCTKIEQIKVGGIL